MNFWYGRYGTKSWKEIKATFIMSILIPYFGWFDHLSWNCILVKRNKWIYRCMTFYHYKQPPNQAGSWKIIDIRYFCMLWFIKVKMKYYMEMLSMYNLPDFLLIVTPKIEGNNNVTQSWFLIFFSRARSRIRVPFHDQWLECHNQQVAK